MGRYGLSTYLYGKSRDHNDAEVLTRFRQCSQFTDDYQTFLAEKWYFLPLSGYFGSAHWHALSPK
jgi:hypothetical protein